MPRNRSGMPDDRYAEANRSLMEQQNNQEVQELAGQVSALRELSINIHTEIEDQNRFLDGMGNTADSTLGSLGATMGKLKHMLDTGGSKHMCYLVAFVVFVFMALWWILSSRR